jgi:hypothetical protein
VPKVSGPLFSLGAGGSLGDGITYQGGRRGARVERRPRHRDAGSAAQLSHRGVFLDAVAYWHALSAAEKAVYNERADPLSLTGYNLCLREYLRGELALSVAVRPTRNGDPSFFFPVSGAAIVATAPADASWSAWAELTAGIGGDCVPSTIYCDVYHTGEFRSLFVALAVGDAPDEEVIATFYVKAVSIATYRHCEKFRLDGYKLAAGTRLSFAIRTDVACTPDAHRVAVAVSAPPSPVLFSPCAWDEDAYRQGGVSGQELHPAAPDFVNTTSGDADDWGSPVEVIASASGHQLVYGVNVRASGAGSSRTAVQVGVGAEGNEVWHEAVQLASAVGAPAGAPELPRPVEVLAGERVAIRSQQELAGQLVRCALDCRNLNF